jgi:hypothetical protein
MGIKQDRFTTFEVRDGLGIKIESLKDWQTRGFITPSIEKAKGRGTKNLFSRFDLYLIKLFESLVQRGFPRKHAAKVLKEIKMVVKVYKEQGTDFDPTGYLIIPWDPTMVHPQIKTKKPSVYFEQSIAPIDLVNLSGCDEIRIINFNKIREFVDQKFS